MAIQCYKCWRIEGTGAVLDIMWECEACRNSTCPTTGVLHRLDDGRCMDCALDLEYSRNYRSHS